jgi:hypothetical protein
MKKAIVIGVLFGLWGCNSSKTETAKNFDWLLGKWLRTNDQEGRKTFEKWEKLNDSTYVGHGYTLQAQDTVWQENMKLISSHGSWDLQVKTHKDSVSTNFKLTTFDPVSFTFENPNNAFPKVIKYKKGEGTLIAEISDADMTVDFIFKPEI